MQKWGFGELSHRFADRARPGIMADIRRRPEGADLVLSCQYMQFELFEKLIDILGVH